VQWICIPLRGFLITTSVADARILKATKKACSFEQANLAGNTPGIRSLAASLYPGGLFVSGID
jgi:hypothetical protein